MTNWWIRKMKTYSSIGTICIKGKCDLIYNVCIIEYFLKEDDTFKYIFTPNYSVIDLLDSNIFQGIPGLNIDLGKEQYLRDNIVPTFISERVPSKNREDYFELLSKVNMDFMDPIEYLIRTKERYSGDKLFVVPYQEKESIKFESFCDTKTNSAIIKNILENICAGNTIIFPTQTIDDNNRKLIHDILMELYVRSFTLNKKHQQEGIEKAKKNGKYSGRKPIRVDTLKFLDLLEKVNNKELSSRQAAEILGISIDKFYRVKKKLQK